MLAAIPARAASMHLTLHEQPSKYAMTEYWVGGIDQRGRYQLIAGPSSSKRAMERAIDLHRTVDALMGPRPVR